MHKDVWVLKPYEAVKVLQAIWNVIYKGSSKEGREKIVHIVKVGDSMTWCVNL